MFGGVNITVKDRTKAIEGTTEADCETIRPIGLVSKDNIEATVDLNGKKLESLTNNCKRLLYLAKCSSNLTSLEERNQVRLLVDPRSDKVNDVMKSNTVPVSIYDKLITFEDSNKERLEVNGDLLEKITKYAFNVGSIQKGKDKKKQIMTSQRKHILIMFKMGKFTIYLNW